MRSIIMILATLLLTANALAAPTCAKDTREVSGLFRLATALPLSWVEVNEKNNNPLIIEMSDKLGEVQIKFRKVKEGDWASGPANICENNSVVTAGIKKGKAKWGAKAPAGMKLFNKPITLKYNNGFMAVAVLGKTLKFKPLLQK